MPSYPIEEEFIQGTLPETPKRPPRLPGKPMPKFAKKIVVNLGNCETLALEVSECSSFLECDVFLDLELNNFRFKHKGVRGMV